MKTKHVAFLIVTAILFILAINLAVWTTCPECLKNAVMMHLR